MHGIVASMTCQSTSHKTLCPVRLVLVARQSQKGFTVHVVRKEVDGLQQAVGYNHLYSCTHLGDSKSLEACNGCLYL